MRSILHVTGMIFLIYGIIILLIIGPYRIFNFFYFIGGIALLILGLLWNRLKDRTRIIVMILLLIAASCFIVTETFIISCAFKKTKEDADYIIVLGSQIRADGPSIDYKARLDSAFAYWNENQNMIVICTGAQGKDEPISEAQGGRDYLAGIGIPQEKIRIEDKSYNTMQNLQNAYEIIKKEGKDPSECKIVIVSASYHLFRASLLAKRIGFNDISCKGGYGLLILQPHYYTREFFALGKELLTSLR